MLSLSAPTSYLKNEDARQDANLTIGYAPNARCRKPTDATNRRWHGPGPMASALHLRARVLVREQSLNILKQYGLVA
jgi:hypothetical protein